MEEDLLLEFTENKVSDKKNKKIFTVSILYLCEILLKIILFFLSLKLYNIKPGILLTNKSSTAIILFQLLFLFFAFFLFFTRKKIGWVLVTSLSVIDLFNDIFTVKLLMKLDAYVKYISTLVIGQLISFILSSIIVYILFSHSLTNNLLINKKMQWAVAIGAIIFGAVLKFYITGVLIKMQL